MLIGLAIRRRYAPMSVLLVLAVQAALAETIPIETGESLKYQCQGFQRMLANSPQEFDEFNGPRCHGYVQGITDALNGQAFCLPPLSLPERVQAVQAYLFAHGDRLKDNAGKLVVEAFAENYPCKPVDQAQPDPAPTPAPARSSRAKPSRH
jgi:hypothetical protein